MPAAPLTLPSGASRARSGTAAPTEALVSAALLGVTMLGLWTWWALASGGFFGVVLLPGAVALYLVLVVAVGLGRPLISARGPHAVALAAFLGLALWTALSLLWTPARELAFDYAQRGFVYAAAFAAGLALASALRRRMLLSVAPWLIAGAIVAGVVVVKILTTTAIDDVVDLDGTLDYPLGYRNTNASFFAALAFGAVPILARPRSGFAVRCGAAALASVAISLAAVSQSRGSMLGVAAGIVVVLAACPHRLRALLGMLVVAAPAALMIGELLDPFDAVDTRAALPELQEAARAALRAGAIAAALAAAWTALGRHGPRVSLPSPSRGAAALATMAAVLVAFGALWLAIGNPVVKVGDQIDRLSSADRGYSEIEGSRFTYTGGLNRVNFWDVALGQASGEPILGEGAGSFRSTYLVQGNGKEAPRNAHSLPLEMLGELGAVGLALLLVAFGAAVAAAWRSRRLGPEAATLSAVALVVAAVVLGQAMVDWNWFFGAEMGPVLALLGSAAAPAALALRPLGPRARGGVALVAVLLALIAVPSFLSESLTLDAARHWRADVDGAYGALGTATDLNPFADTPLLVEAQIAKSSGDPPTALAALEEAQGRAPKDWRKYRLAAEVLARSDRGAALEQAEQALALNPSSGEVKALRRRLLDRGGGDASP